MTHALKSILLESSSARFVAAELGVQFSVGSLQLADDRDQGHNFVQGNDGTDRSSSLSRGGSCNRTRRYFCF
jgi:hypothetical protein